MSVSVSDEGVILLGGHCTSDDAGTLLERLLADPQAAVDWRTCDGAHTAVIQVLLAARRPLRGPPRDGFLSRWVEPLLRPR